MPELLFTICLNATRERNIVCGCPGRFDSITFPFVDSDKPTIPKNAYLMIHKPWCDCEGNANELRKMADTLEAIEAGIWSIYEEHLAEGVTIEQIKELMEAETWLSGEEAANTLTCRWEKKIPPLQQSRTTRNYIARTRRKH